MPKLPPRRDPDGLAWIGGYIEQMTTHKKRQYVGCLSTSPRGRRIFFVEVAGALPAVGRGFGADRVYYGTYKACLRVLTSIRAHMRARVVALHPPVDWRDAFTIPEDTYAAPAKIKRVAC